MENNLAQKAVSFALSGDWEQAVIINKEILKTNPKDIDALNRLARAYAEQGNMVLARKTANKVIKLDPFNKIALKSFTKWKGLKNGDTIVSGPSSAQAFLEEPGKTKIITLIHLGDATLLVKIDSGDEVNLNPFSHRISVNTNDGKYIGRLADDISARIRKLISLGYEYQAFVKSSDSKGVRVLVREIKRPEKYTDVSTFSTEKMDYISFTPPELVHKKNVLAHDDR